MSKIICEICGTTYQPNQSRICPICGWSHNAVPAEEENAEGEYEEMYEEDFADRGGKFTNASLKKKNRDIFDYDAVNSEDEYGTNVEDELSPYTEDEVYEEPQKTSTFLIVLLVLVIAILLLTSAFIFFRYFLPNNSSSKDSTGITTAATEEEPTEETETTVPTVPCTSLAVTSGKVELTREGQFFLLNVVMTPEDTTDVLTFESENESIVTVSADGKITAVGEGETNILIKCGEQTQKCPVLALFVEDLTPPPPTETAPPEIEAPAATEAGTADTPADVTPAETKAETAGEASDTSSNDTTAPLKADVTLKLKRTDLTIGRRGVYIELELDCDLTVDEVQWSIGNPNVASIDKNKVTAVGPGVTIATVKYGSQTVDCYIRCIF